MALVYDISAFANPAYANNIYFNNPPGGLSIVEMSVPQMGRVMTTCRYEDANQVGMRRVGMRIRYGGPNGIPHNAITDTDVFRLLSVYDAYLISTALDDKVRIEITVDQGSLIFDFIAGGFSSTFVSSFVNGGIGIDLETYRFFEDLWKIELALQADGALLWDYYLRAQTLPAHYQAMIRAACDQPITFIPINLTDLYQDPISLTNIVEGEYYITNYTGPGTPLGQYPILSIASLIGILGSANPRDPRRMVPIISITKVRIVYIVSIPEPRGLKRPRSRSLEGGQSPRRRNPTKGKKSTRIGN